MTQKASQKRSRKPDPGSDAKHQRKKYNLLVTPKHKLVFSGTLANVKICRSQKRSNETRPMLRCKPPVKEIYYNLLATPKHQNKKHQTLNCLVGLLQIYLVTEKVLRKVPTNPHPCPHAYT